MKFIFIWKKNIWIVLELADNTYIQQKIINETTLFFGRRLMKEIYYY